MPGATAVAAEPMMALVVLCFLGAAAVVVFGIVVLARLFLKWMRS